MTISARTLLGAALLAPLMTGCATVTHLVDLFHENPLLETSSLPYQMPPFDRIEPGHFEPALEQAMAEHSRELEVIANNPQAPTFDNTIVALERAGQTLDRVESVFYNLASADTNPVLDDLDVRFSPKLAAHEDSMLLNARLFKRVQAIYRQRESLELDPESLRLVERYHLRFVRAGAELDEAGKSELREINAELAGLTSRFDQALTADSNALAVTVDSAGELAGFSDDAVEAAANAARTRGSEAAYLIPLQLPSGQPALAQLDNRALRERLMRASLSRGNRGNANDTKAMLLRIVRLRARRAELMGYANHAEYVLADATARNPAAVNERLAQLAPAAAANARREAQALEAIMPAAERPLQPWDWAYYSDKLKRQRYQLDTAALRPYFELNSVLTNGVFYMAEQVYGLTFKRRDDLPVYHPTVSIYEVFDRDGSGLGLFLFDPYSRDSKRGGAWMNAYVSQSTLRGTRPVVANHLNITPPSPGEPALLTFEEVETMFHEFGHALHGLFSDVRYPLFAGTRVPRDFVEYPSQVHEMWATWPQVLAHYARHYRTGEPMPQELVDKVLESESFNQGFATTEYLAASVIDQAWHQLSSAEAEAVTDVEAFERQALASAGLDLPQIPPRYHSTYFQHIFAGGYAAGYYAYIWSEVLDADTVEWFKENGGMTRANGDRFREAVLSRGGAVEALDLFRDLRNREPDITPLLKRRGLDVTT